MQITRTITLTLAVLTLGVSGCTHMISFHGEETSWHYQVSATRQSGAALVAVVDAATLADAYSFRALSTGIAHEWVAQDGVMLGQVADVDLPQIVQFYERSTSYKEPSVGDQRLTVVLTLPDYTFEDYRARVRIHVDAFAPGHHLVFSKDYTGTGDSQAGKMIGLGAFGQKSAVRQSSLEAFREAFDAMRPDLVAALSPSGSAVGTVP